MMIKVLTAAALLGTLFPPLTALAAGSGQTTIYATGQATVSAPPDIATVSFSANTHAATAEQATSENNRIYARFSTGMRAIGIAAADIKTTGYNLNHVPPPPPCPPMPMRTAPPNAEFAQSGNPVTCVRDPESYGYFVTRSMSVTVHRLDTVGKVIDTAVASGVNNVQGVDYAIANTRAIFMRALGQAVSSARSEADVMAQAAGLHVVGVQSINSQGAIPAPIAFSARMMQSANAYAVPTQISPPSSLDVSANVSVVYLAQP